MSDPLFCKHSGCGNRLLRVSGYCELHERSIGMRRRLLASWSALDWLTVCFAFASVAVGVLCVVATVMVFLQGVG